MNLPDPALNRECPSTDISAYIDGELSIEALNELEEHLAVCRLCSNELNEQKKFIQVLDHSLGNDLEIPADFTKRIVTNAESTVGGLRRRNEWLSALFVCCALFFFILFTLGANAGNAFGVFFDVFGRLVAVAGFAAHFVYDVSIGGVIILRSIGSQPGFGQRASLALVGTLIVLLYWFSRPRRGIRTRIDSIESGNRF